MSVVQAAHKARARLAAHRRFGNAEAAAEAELDLREAMLAKRIHEIADAAPPLSAERRARLAALLQQGIQAEVA
jgi:hypothetical protein